MRKLGLTARAVQRARRGPATQARLPLRRVGAADGLGGARSAARRCTAVRCSSSDHQQLQPQQQLPPPQQLDKSTAAEALAFVKANRGRWVQWLKEKDLSMLGNDPARLGSAAHVLFHKEMASQPGTAAQQPGQGQPNFALRRGCTARVATYNVLCSELAEPDYFTHCDPANLDADTRYARVVARLGPEMERNAVICLQEVSREWAGRLHSFFAQRGYHFVMDAYSKQQTGYMGVGIAVPIAQYDIVECDIRRVADTGPVSVQAELEAAELQRAAAEEALQGEQEESRELLGIGGPQGYALRESVRYGVRNAAEVEHDGHMAESGGRSTGGGEGIFQRAVGWLTGRSSSHESESGVLAQAAEEQAAAVSIMRNASSSSAGTDTRASGGDSKRKPRSAGKRRAGRGSPRGKNDDRPEEEDEEVDVAANIEVIRKSLQRGSPWELAMRRHNVLLFVRLRCVRSGAVFGCVAFCSPATCPSPTAPIKSISRDLRATSSASLFAVVACGRTRGGHSSFLAHTCCLLHLVMLMH
jgi:hypothetical protein